ncbi:hypothetical protein BJF84_00085 [Rhodococcus sp. CUA-806]|nr:hypothetical protein BJF84_00085 [Rhodococcus sp. CUA-806]
MSNQVKIQIEAKANLAAIDEAVAKLKALKDKRVKVDIDVDQAALRKLDTIRDKRIKVDVDVNDSKIRALRDRRIKVRVMLIPVRSQLCNHVLRPCRTKLFVFEFVQPKIVSTNKLAISFATVQPTSMLL